MLYKTHSPVIANFSAVVTEINTACLSQNPSWSKSTETKTLPCGAAESATSFNGDDSAITGKTIALPSKKTKLTVTNKCHPCLLTNKVSTVQNISRLEKLLHKQFQNGHAIRKFTFDEQFTPD